MSLKALINNIMSIWNVYGFLETTIKLIQSSKIRCSETYNSPIIEEKHNTNFKSLLCMSIRMFPVFNKLTKNTPTA